MESMAIDVNGGNAEMARDKPNLENNETPIDVANDEINEKISDETIIEDVKMEEESEINGDVKVTKKKSTPIVRKKLRKFKANTPTSNADNDAKNHAKGLKRKFSEPDDLSSEDSTEFNGFDNQLIRNIEPGSQVLQKLIAEAESAETPPLKRNRRSTYKALGNMKNNDEKDDSMDDDTPSPIGHRVKKEKESDTDSIGIPISLESETDVTKTEESSIKSTNSSANSSPSGARPKLKIGKIVRGVSPASGMKQKVTVDMTNPSFREPFKYGWKRELVFRAGSDQNSARRMADIYYYTPKGKKVRSFREVAESLHSKDLTIDNFTFFKEPLGVNNPDFEIIRDARVRDSTGPVPTPPKKYTTPKKLPPKRIVEKPLTPPPPAKIAAKSPKVTPAGFKIKLPGKKGQQKKEAKSPTKEPAMLPPQWSSPPTTRRSQPIVEKTPPAKPKRVIKAKLQEPCSIRCSSSMGLIPSLQCSLCLCLYHPECVDAKDIQPIDDYVCKNCHEDVEKSDGSAIVSPPPPLIPISMMRGSSPSIGQTSAVSPPKLQKIQKVVNSTKSPRKIGKKSKISRSSSDLSPSGGKKKETGWSSTGSEYLRGQDGTMPKPAQNIALMAGKRYIVVPKNNAMAVQPAITARNEKTVEKTPITPEATQAEMPVETSRTITSGEFSKSSKNGAATRETANLPESIETVENIDETLRNDRKLENSGSSEKFDYDRSNSTELIKSDTKKEDVEKLINELTDETPVASHEPEVPVEQPEVPVERPEVPVEQPEVPIKQPEVPVEQSEVPVERPEVPVKQPEVPIDQPEVPVDEAEVPVKQQEVPFEQPKVLAEQPEVSVEQPEVPLKPPEVSLNQPEVSLKQPEVSLKQPEVSFKQPEVSLKQPEGTRKQPEVSVEQPEVPLKQPEVLLKEPEVLLKEPEVLLKEPEVPFKEPEISLKEPDVSLKQPEGSLKHQDVSAEQPEVPCKKSKVIDESAKLQKEIITNVPALVETKISRKNMVNADKKKPVPLETDPRHFMVSVCAGYHALSRIFQYLKVQELLRAARVCKMWRDLAAHPNLWKTVRMKNSQVTDWDGLADSLKRHGTQHLDLRKMLVAGESDGIWKKFVTVIPRVTSLVKLELCRCPVMVVEEVIKSCPQLQILSAMSIKCDTLNLDSVGNLKSCRELRLKAISGMSLQGDLTPLQELTQLTHLSLTSVKELGKKNIDVLGSLINLETLELGECSDFPEKFGTSVLLKLVKLERLRLEKGQGTCCTFDILDGVSKLPLLHQLELVNFDVKNGFDKCLSNCKNIKRLLIIPTYISQSATSNNMVLGGVTELSNNLTHFVWGVTLELLRVTELFVDQCNQMNKQVTGDSIPVLKPVPCLKLIEDVADEGDSLKSDEKPQSNLTNPQVDILPLPQLQKLLLTALPKTRVKILKIPFHATWRQSISDTTTQ